jgi:hypothetical protein
LNQDNSFASTDGAELKSRNRSFFRAQKTILEARISLATLGRKGNEETERGELLHGRLFGLGRILGVNSFSAPVGMAMV